LPDSKELREIQFFIKKRPRNFDFKGGLFQNKYNRKGQVKFSSYTQYMSVFENSLKAFILRVIAFSMNLFYRVNIVIYIKIIVFL